MPIVDVQLVVAGAVVESAPFAQAIADSLGKLFGSSPGNTWVRVSTLMASSYAENESNASQLQLPVFVTLLFASPPEGEARAIQAASVAKAVALVAGRDQGCVHIEYSAPGKGRIAFGGVLVR